MPLEHLCDLGSRSINWDGGPGWTMDPEEVKERMTAKDWLDGAFWNLDGLITFSTDDDFPAYWMPRPLTPWERP